MIISAKETFQTIQRPAIASQQLLPYLDLVNFGQKCDNQLKTSIEKQFGRENEPSDRRRHDEISGQSKANQNIGASLD